MTVQQRRYYTETDDQVLSLLKRKAKPLKNGNLFTCISYKEITELRTPKNFFCLQ